MANMLENYGLDFFAENDDTLMGLIGYVVKEGKALTGYYGVPCIFKAMGDVEIWVKTEENTEGGLRVSEFDTRSSNFCVWNLLHSGIDITPKKASKLERVVMFNSLDSRGGLLPVEVISADIMPSWMKDDEFTMQMTALPLTISYYANEEEYENSQPESDEDGKKWLISNGSLMALSFLCNHNPDQYDKDMDYESDRFVHFTATVKKVYHGTFELNGEKHNTFIRCLADTEYGELEFDHTLEQVPEDLRDNIREGAIISGVCILSGDVAIHDYKDGAIKDFDHDLKLLRYTIGSGDPERLYGVLSPDAIYETDTSNIKYVGAKEIVDRFSYIHGHRKNEYTTYYATITKADGLEYPVGTRCIVLADGEDNYESIAFIDVNEDGLITKLKISTDSGYSFKIDEPKKIKSLLDDYELPDNVFEPIVARAKFNGIIDNDLDSDELIKSITANSSFDRNVNGMLDALKNDPQPDAEEALSRIMGYLFAKSIERSYNERRYDHKGGMRLMASFIPEEAFAGEISSTLAEKEHAVLENAMKLGSQFFNDFKFFVQANDAKEEQFVEAFTQAAILVQRIGELYSEHCFE